MELEAENWRLCSTTLVRGVGWGAGRLLAHAQLLQHAGVSNLWSWDNIGRLDCSFKIYIYILMNYFSCSVFCANGFDYIIGRGFCQ